MFELNDKTVVDTKTSFEEEMDLPPVEEAPGKEAVPALPTPPWQKMEESLAAIQKTLEEKEKEEQYWDFRFRKLYDDLSAYQGAAVDKLLDDLLLEVAAIKEGLDEQVDDLSEQTGLLISQAAEIRALHTGATLCRKMVKLLREVQTQLEGILYQNNVEKFTCTEFDPEKQHLQKRRTASYAAPEQEIHVQNVKHGYTRDGRVIRKQLVDLTLVESYEALEILDELSNVVPQRRTDLMELAEED